MIYLIKSAGYKELSDESVESFFLLKIGYTEDSNKNSRFSAYKMHNPTCKVLYEIPGLTEEDEKNVQYKFRKYLYPDYGMEWFEYSEEIIEFFKNPNIVENIKSLPKCPILEQRELSKLKQEVKIILWVLKGINNDIDIKFLYKEIFDRKIRSIDLVYEFLEISINKESIERCKYLLECRETGVYCEDNLVNREVSNFMNEYENLTLFKQKLKLLCEYGLSNQAIQIVLDQIGEHDNIKSYYTILKPQKLKALGYDRYKIEKELGIVTFSKELLVNTILSKFSVGDRISQAKIKEILGGLYSSINYTATPKATDLENFFETKEAKVNEILSDGSKKRVKATDIIGVKPEYQEIYNNLKTINNIL